MFGKGKYIILGLLCQCPCAPKLFDYLYNWLGGKW
jgi:hypothetical protein